MAIDFSQVTWDDTGKSYSQLIADAATAEGIPVELAYQVHSAGEKFRPNNPTSPKGAHGPMQLMPATFAQMAQELGFEKPDIKDDEQNIRAGVHYLKQQLDRFGHPVLAVAAYNAGPGAVQKYGGVPPYKETKGYVKRIMDALGPSTAYAADVPKPGQGQIDLSTVTWDEPGTKSELPDLSTVTWDEKLDPKIAGAAILSDPTKSFAEAAREVGQLPTENKAAQAMMKGAGVLAGAANAPFAFGMGGARAALENPEEWAKTPFWKKTLIATGGGFESAWESISKEGKWGATINDFSKAELGKTIPEMLPEGMQWAAPTVEFLASMALDPMITVGEASRIIKGLGNKKAFGELSKILPSKMLPNLEEAKLPAKFIDDLNVADNEIAKWTAGEKEVLQERLLGLLKKREDYARFQESIPAVRDPLIERGLGVEAQMAPEEAQAAYNALSGRVQSAPPMLPPGTEEVNQMYHAATEQPGRITVSPSANEMQRMIMNMLQPEQQRVAGTLPAPSEALARGMYAAESEKIPTTEAPRTNEVMNMVYRMLGYPEERVELPTQNFEMVRDPNRIDVVLNPRVEPVGPTYPPLQQGQRFMSGEEQAVPILERTGTSIAPRTPEAERAMSNKAIEELRKVLPPQIAEKVLPPATPEISPVAAPTVKGGEVSAKPVQPAQKGKEPWEMTRNEAVPKPPEIPEPPRPLAKRYGKNWESRPDAAELRKQQSRESSVRSKALKEYRAHVEASNKHLASIEEALANGSLTPERADELGHFDAYPYLRDKGKDSTAEKWYQKSSPGYIKFGDKDYSDLLAQNPNWKRVAETVQDVERDLPWLSKAGAAKGFLDAQEKLLDRFVRLKNITPETYEEARKHLSYRDVAHLEWEELRQSLQEVRGAEKAFRDYVTARRMETRAGIVKMATTKPDVAGATKVGPKQWIWQIRNPGNVTAAEAKAAQQEILNGFKAAGGDPAKLQQASDSFNQWTKANILEPLRDGGIIGDDAYRKILADNDFYAAFDVIDHLPRDLAKIPSNLPSKEYFSVANQKIIKALSGTEKAIADPIESTLKKWINAKDIIARNKVASTFIDEALTSADPQLSGQIRPIAESGKEFKLLQRQGLNPIHSKQIGRDLETISRFVDGRIEKYAVPIEYADVMKSLTQPQIGKFFRGLNNIFRQAATSLYAPFVISNAVRDAFMAFNTSGVYKAADVFPKYQLDWTRGLIEGLKHEFGGKSATVKEYLKAGGGMGYVGEIREASTAKKGLFKPSGMQQAMNIVKSPITLLEKLGSSVELAPRVGVFERAQKVGKTAEEAAMLARESTIDFNKAGTTMRIANQWIPFLNARVQGRLQVGRAIWNRPLDTASKLFASTIIPAGAAYYANRTYYSDLYDDIPDYVKNGYFTLIIGTDQDKFGKTIPKYISIPKGDLAQMVWNPIEQMLNGVYEKDRPAFTEFATNWLSDISPVPLARDGEFSAATVAGGVIPPFAKAVIEPAMNRSFFTGREIDPSYMQDKPPELRYTEKTPETYKNLSAMLAERGIANVSPLKLQNIMGNLLAGYGREGLDPAAMLRGMTGKFVQTKGGEKESRGFDIYDSVKQGYEYTRSRAEELIKGGDREGALQLMIQWNQGLQGQIERMGQQGFQDKGGMRMAFTFTPDKIIGVIKNTLAPQRRSPLEERLLPKRYR